MIDISNAKELSGYLAAKKSFLPLKNAGQLQIDYVSGGVSGTVALVSDGEREVIVKQALGRLKVSELWECDPKRLLTEKHALETYASIVPEHTPEVLYYDDENDILIRQAAPKLCEMWKAQLQRGLFDFKVAADIIEALIKIHNKTSGDRETESVFQNTEVFVNLRLNPYIMFTTDKYPELRPLCGEVMDFLLNRRICLVHGDFSPKNILVGGGTYIIDHEVAVYGNPCFDLAFLSNHFLLKTVRYREYGITCLEMLRFMWRRYMEKIKCMPYDEISANTVKTLILLFLARVDGKSPAEYIQSDADKNVVRKTALEAAKRNVTELEDLLEIMLSNIKNQEACQE